jgi:hypothetical protein
MRRSTGSSPVDVFLGGLDRVRHSGTGWTARCPAHDDKWPSLSIAEGRDGRVLMHCHAGCRTEDIVAAIDFSMVDLFPQTVDGSLPTPRGKAKDGEHEAPRIPLGVFRRLVSSSEFAFTWRAATLLARFEPRAARVQVLNSWEYFTSQCNVELLLQLAYLVRGIVMLRFCTSKDADPYTIGRAVVRRDEDLQR